MLKSNETESYTDLWTKSSSVIIKINCSLIVIELHRAHINLAANVTSLTHVWVQVHSPANKWHMSFCFDASDSKQLLAFPFSLSLSLSLSSYPFIFSHSTRGATHYSRARTLAVVNNEMISVNCIEIRALNRWRLDASFLLVRFTRHEIGSDESGIITVDAAASDFCAASREIMQIRCI